MIEFRLGNPDDLERFLPLIQAYYRYDNHEYDEAKVRRALNGLLHDARSGLAWLIEDQDEAVGYAVVCFGYSLEFGGRDAFIDELYLDEQHRGQGIGARMIEHMAQVCRDQGVQALHLEVMPGNNEVIRLYARAGFVNRGSSLMSRYLTAQ
ncbi:MAG: GNAT family N-acetyltransferase [Anaerolineae bacterium]|nr:GNAT family N-acetyltransferase [Anaerolineae bacterium]